MREIKALGPDRFQCGFFQEYWDIVGEDVIGIVKYFFNQSSSIASINQTFIALIPKLKALESLSNFRPINLCISFYSIISKTIANRMKEVFS